jgi:lysophospholipase L1-like esterase
MAGMLRSITALAAMVLMCAPVAQGKDKWVTSWAASVHGPYPTGNASAQPDLHFAFPSAATGAREQTFRLIVMPDVWGPQIRLRLSNAFGTRPVTFDGVFAGLHGSGGTVVAGTNRAARFGGKGSVTVAPGEQVWTDAIALGYSGTLAGGKLAISFHVAGESGPMTWHAKALTTSYLTAAGAGSKGDQEGEAAFPFTTTSWYFLDAIDVMAPEETKVIVALGDSITDGTASTLNGDDRWPNVLSRRLHAMYGDRVSVVNAGIGGNQVVGPAEYSAEKPFAGGPSVGQRLERDVLSLSGVTAVVWLEGINDFSRNADATVAAVEAGMKDVVGRIRAKLPKARVIGATVTPALGSSNAAHGSAGEDVKRKELNEFIRHSGVFDGVADFDQATVDAQSGGLRAEFVPDSTTGGAGDKLHPNRAGYLAMGMAIDLKMLME